MNAQKPAEGILLMNEFGVSKMYKAICQCGQDDHSHVLDIDADETGVHVTIYTTTKTKWWSINRWKQIWLLLTKGYIEQETVLSMNKQVALNYTDVLQSAIKDTEEFQKERNVKIKSS
jgi:hypothetical protein